MLTVFASHTGKTLELDCSSTTSRVEDVQQTLAALTGLPVADQILTCDGVPLAPGNLLSAYGLQASESGGGGGGRSRDVFLYSRTLLRADAAMPKKETLPPLSAPTTREEDTPPSPPHSLDSADSPLLRALPQYCRQFQEHLQRVQVAAEAGAARVALCCRLVNEGEVQALAVDAAMTSVEPHYAFICNAHAVFQEKFSKRYSVHEDVLGTFEADLDFLHSVQLPSSLAASGGVTFNRLSDLVDVSELRRIAAECARSHRHFASRVTELEALHTSLRNDVEALFMRAPTIDLDSLAEGLAAAQSAADDQAATAQALAADLRRAETALQEGVLGAPSVSSGLKDAVGMLEAMHESHVTSALPRVEQCQEAIETFARRCVDEKNALAADALRALRTVASQQSRIREMREAMAPFPAALERQDAQVARLLIARRLPAAYKQSLAECARRAAFNEKYSAFAADLAERMGKFRQKEVAVREKFRRHVAGLMPEDLLQAMGLDQSPPHCQVSVPGDEAVRLLPVTPDDLRMLQLPRRGGVGTSTGLGGERTTPPGGPSPRGAVPGEELGSGATSTSGLLNSLQMENVRLRADLASQIALDCIRVAELAALAPVPSPTSSAPASPRLPEGSAPPPSIHAGSASGSTHTGAPTVLAADAAVKFERALVAKDALFKEAAASAANEAAILKERIRLLEAQVAALSVQSSGADVDDRSISMTKSSEQSEQADQGPGQSTGGDETGP